MSWQTVGIIIGCLVWLIVSMAIVNLWADAEYAEHTPSSETWAYNTQKSSQRRIDPDRGESK